MNRSPRSRVAPLAASFVALFALGLAACGDDDDADTTSPGTDVTAPIDTAVSDTAATDTPGTDVGSSTPGSGSAAGEVGTEDDYIEATSEALPWDDDEMSDCVAVVLIDAIGYDQIQEAGVTVAQLADEGPSALGLTIEQESLGDVSGDVAGCGDLLEKLATEEMEDSERSCIEDNLDNDQLSELLVAQFFQLDPSDDVATGSEAVDTCISGLTTTSLAS